jgi:hypothetical protein
VLFTVLTGISSTSAISAGPRPSWKRRITTSRCFSGNVARLCQLAAALLPSSLVDAAVGRDPPQPVRKVSGRLYAIEVLVQLQKNLLRQVFRQRAVLQEVIGDAEHHALVLAHQFGKGQPVTLHRLCQRQVEPIVLKSRNLLQKPSFSRFLNSYTHQEYFRVQICC